MYVCMYVQYACMLCIYACMSSIYLPICGCRSQVLAPGPPFNLPDSLPPRFMWPIIPALKTTY